jgi:hypothetical protein
MKLKNRHAPDEVPAPERAVVLEFKNGTESCRLIFKKELKEEWWREILSKLGEPVWVWRYDDEPLFELE